MKAGALVESRPTISEFRTLDDYLSEALQLPFEAQYIKPAVFDKKTVEAIDGACRAYNVQFLGKVIEDHKFPARDDSDLRTGIFRQERVGGRVVRQHLYVGEDIAALAKQALLFHHSVLIPSFWVPSRGAVFDTDEKRIAKAVADTSEYLRYGTLIRRRIVIPVPLELTMGVDFDDPWLVPYTKPGHQVGFSRREETAISQATDILRARRPELPNSYAKNLVIGALMARSECNALGSAYDPYFRDRDICDAYLASVAAMQNSMSSSDAHAPTRMHTLSTRMAVDTTKLTDADFIKMRDNEELFQVWRRLAQKVVDHMDRTRLENNNAVKELDEFVRHEQAGWNAQVDAILSGGGFIPKVVDALKEGWFNAMVGSGVALIVEGNVTLGALPAGARALAKIFGHAVTAAHNRPARISFRNHFFALTRRGVRN